MLNRNKETFACFDDIVGHSDFLAFWSLNLFWLFRYFQFKNLLKLLKTTDVKNKDKWELKEAK
jgi:hypothetical protein